MKSTTLKELSAYLAQEAARLEKIERAEIEWVRDEEYPDVYRAEFRNVQITLGIQNSTTPGIASGSMRINTIENGDASNSIDIAVHTTKREWILKHAKADLLLLAQILRPLIEAIPPASPTDDDRRDEGGEA